MRDKVSSRQYLMTLHAEEEMSDDNLTIYDIAEFEKIEEILEDYGLAKLMEEVEEEEPLSKDEALKYYQSLKDENVAS